MAKKTSQWITVPGGDPQRLKHLDWPSLAGWKQSGVGQRQMEYGLIHVQRQIKYQSLRSRTAPPLSTDWLTKTAPWQIYIPSVRLGQSFHTNSPCLNQKYSQTRQWGIRYWGIKEGGNHKYAPALILKGWDWVFTQPARQSLYSISDGLKGSGVIPGLAVGCLITAAPEPDFGRANRLFVRPPCSSPKGRRPFGSNLDEIKIEFVSGSTQTWGQG